MSHRARKASHRDSTDESPPAKEYTPRSAIKLFSNDGYSVSLRTLEEYVPIEVGDYFHIEFQGGMDIEGEPMLMFSNLGPDVEDPGRNVMRVQKNYRLTIPAVYVSEANLGVDPDTYTGDDPLIFYPYYEPGDDIFALTPIGFGSELFTNTPDDLPKVLPPQTRPKHWSAEEFSAYTSYDPETDEELGIAHVQELYNKFRDAEFRQTIREEADTEYIPWDFIIPKYSLSDQLYYRTRKRWLDIQRQTYLQWLKKLPWRVTATLFDRVGLHDGNDPFIVERDGMRYEIHLLEKNALTDIGRHIYRAPEAALAMVSWRHNATGRFFVEELYAAKGKEVPESFYARTQDKDILIIPTGEAQTYPDSQVAVDVHAYAQDMFDGVTEGEVSHEKLLEEMLPTHLEAKRKQSQQRAARQTQTEQAESSSAQTDDQDGEQMKLGDVTEATASPAITVNEDELNKQFWGFRPFTAQELVDRYNRGHEPADIADEFDVSPSVVESSLAKLGVVIDEVEGTDKTAATPDNSKPETADNSATGGTERADITLPDREFDSQFWNFRPFEPEDLVNLYNQGYGTEAIAEKYDVSADVIESSFRKLGVNLGPSDNSPFGL
jgi:uncharacterized protein (DUF433 family)